MQAQGGNQLSAPTIKRKRAARIQDAQNVAQQLQAESGVPLDYLVARSKNAGISIALQSISLFYLHSSETDPNLNAKLDGISCSTA
jgi:hypothetical protein